VSNFIFARVRSTFGDETLARELVAEAVGSLRHNFETLLGSSPIRGELTSDRDALHDVFFYLMLNDDTYAEAVSFIFSVGFEMRVLARLLRAPKDADIEQRLPEALLERLVAIRERLEATPVGEDGRALLLRLEGVLASVVGKSPREILTLLEV
jgi:hypothetical protein